MDIEQQIRLQAYEIWLAAGMGEGDAERHWLQAERAVIRTSADAAKEVATKPVAAKTVTAKPAALKSAAVKKPAAKAKPAKAATPSTPAETKTTMPRRAKAAAARGGAEASA